MIKVFEEFNKYDFGVGDSAVLLINCFPFKEGDIVEILLVDKKDDKLPYEIGSKLLKHVAWVGADHLRKVEQYEIDQNKYNL